MKKPLPFLLLIIATSFLFSCGNGVSEKNLIGTWKAVDMHFGVDNIDKERLRAERKNLQEEMQNITYTFYENGEVEIRDKRQKEFDRGIYKLTKSGILVIDYPDIPRARQNQIEILSIKGDYMTWRPDFVFGNIHEILEKQ